MSAAKKLSNALQALIDNRLDAIDQNLLRAGVPRHQRQSIAEEVENQILEMLMRLEHDEWTRADVLAVLARLDPPEAYVPEDGPPRPESQPAAGSPAAGASAADSVVAAAQAGVQASVAAASQAVRAVRSRWQPAWLACFAAALGGFTLFLTLAYLSTIGPSHDSAAVGILFLMILAGGSTLMGAYSLYHLGGSNGPKYALVAALFATLLYPLLTINGLVLALGTVTYPVSVGLLVLIVFGAANAVIARYCWRRMTQREVKPAETGTAAAPLIISS